MIILVINCGSSSVKYQLFDIDRNKGRSLAKGIVERIATKLARLVHKRGASKNSFIRSTHCPDHSSAIAVIIDALTDRKVGVIGSSESIQGVGHRVVHGGEEFKESTRITKEIVRSIEAYSELAPLHNPPSILGIKACLSLLGHLPQVAVFDTSFHQTIPPHAFMYGLPYIFYKRYGIRRYGFHGTSHRYVARQAAKILKKNPVELKLITCHLGNGCSMTAVDRGKSVDTSMGFTPLEGLLMGTRTGDLDAAIVMYLLDKEHVTLDRMNDIVNKESGLLGVSGLSNDMRDIVRAASKGNSRARLALDMFIYRIKKYIGAYAAAMNGLDAVVMTAGIGENNPWIIRKLSRELNRAFGKKVRFLVVPTNEELLIAQDTYNAINGKASKRYRLSA